MVYQDNLPRRHSSRRLPGQAFISTLYHSFTILFGGSTYAIFRTKHPDKHPLEYGIDASRVMQQMSEDAQGIPSSGRDHRTAYIITRFTPIQTSIHLHSGPPITGRHEARKGASEPAVLRDASDDSARSSRPPTPTVISGL
jgi:hypothetical protein